MKHQQRISRQRGPRRLAIWTIAAVTLAACASPPSQFYTLGSGDVAADGAAGNPAAAAVRAPNPTLLIEVAPVAVPAEVARNQLVVQTGEASVSVLEQRRWAALPGEEIRRALSGDLAARLGTFDVYGSPYPAGVPVYRVTVNVQRFESWPGKHAAIDAVWSVRALGNQAVVTCGTSATVPVGAGFATLVEGHRRAIAQMADQIAATVRAFGTRAPAAPSPATTCAAGRRTSGQ